MRASKQQQTIIDAIKGGNNVYTDAVPGAGKSTLAFCLAEQTPDKLTTVLTFSKDLKQEARDKIKKLGLTNIRSESYNSFARNYYHKRGSTDINYIIRKDIPLNNTFTTDILVLDETQDMTKTVYVLICKLLRDLQKIPLILVLGDKDQGVFKFMEADNRFLKFANNIFPGRFLNLSLNHSFRLTDAVADFVNDVLVGEQKIKTDKPGHPINYIIADPYSRAFYNYVYRYIERCIQEEGYTYDDIFILSPSVRNPGLPIKKLNQFLASRYINGKMISLFINHNDEEVLDGDCLEGKIVMTTFHQSKGRERKLVIMMGFDEGYYRYFNKKPYNPSDECPSPIYVAATRSKERLVVVHGHSSGNPFKTIPCMKIKLNELAQKDYCNVDVICQIRCDLNSIQNITPVPQNSKYSVTELISYLPDDIVNQITIDLDTLFTRIKKGKRVKLKSSIKSFGLKENVSDINGIMIPNMWEYRIKQASTIYNEVVKLYSRDTSNSGLLKREYDRIEYPCKTIAHYLQLGNIYLSLRNGHHENLNQIRDFDWLNEEQVEHCIKNVEQEIEHKDSMLKFEVNMVNENSLGYDTFIYEHKNYGQITIGGVCDIINDTYLYEIKCTNELSFEHKLQLLIYAWMYERSIIKMYCGPRKYRLFNMLSGETLELITDKMYLIDNIVELILKSKLEESTELTDNEFIESCNGIKEQYLP